MQRWYGVLIVFFFLGCGADAVDQGDAADQGNTVDLKMNKPYSGNTEKESWKIIFFPNGTGSLRIEKKNNSSPEKLVNFTYDEQKKTITFEEGRFTANFQITPELLAGICLTQAGDGAEKSLQGTWKNEDLGWEVVIDEKQMVWSNGMKANYSEMKPTDEMKFYAISFTDKEGEGKEILEGMIFSPAGSTLWAVPVCQTYDEIAECLSLWKESVKSK